MTTLGVFLSPSSTSRSFLTSAAFSRSSPFSSSKSFLLPSLLQFAIADDKTCNTGFSRNHHQQQRGLAAMSGNNDELAKAQDAKAEEVTIFDKIVAGDIPCTEVYSDDKALAFRDVNPQAPVHIVVIPKNRDGLSQLSKARPDQKELLGHLLYVGMYRQRINS